MKFCDSDRSRSGVRRTLHLDEKNIVSRKLKLILIKTPLCYTSREQKMLVFFQHSRTKIFLVDLHMFNPTALRKAKVVFNFGLLSAVRLKEYSK